MAVTFVGVFSKESAVVILGVIVLYELVWWRERRNLRGLLFGCAAIAPPLLAMWYARSIVVPGSPQFPFVDNPLVAADFWTARLTALKVIARYLGLLVWPAHLSVDYSYAEIPLARGSASDWFAWSIVAIAIAAVIAFRRNRDRFICRGICRCRHPANRQSAVSHRHHHGGAVSLFAGDRGSGVPGDGALRLARRSAEGCASGFVSDHSSIRRSHLGSQHGLAGRFEFGARHGARRRPRATKGMRCSRPRCTIRTPISTVSSRKRRKASRRWTICPHCEITRRLISRRGCSIWRKAILLLTRDCGWKDGNSRVGAAGLSEGLAGFGAVRLDRPSQQCSGE